MSKMGISTVVVLLRRAGLRGGRPGPAAGRALLHRHHQPASAASAWPRSTPRWPPGTRRAYPANAAERAHRRLEVGGEYQWRREGEVHLFNPETVFLLQHATRSRPVRRLPASTPPRWTSWPRGRGSLRGLFELRTATASRCRSRRSSRPAEIVKRFATGAMSLRLDLGRGARDPGHRDEPARRQVQHRRGRRGRRAAATTRRGARRSSRSPAAGSASPPSTWSTPTTCRSRWPRAPSPARAASCPATRCGRGSPRPGTPRPGVGLISPPPHHDIYSIEDLAQLVYDLKNVNPAARVHVKLVSEVGVGTVAAGVAKTKADVILISGHDGGTGASPLNSLKHAGTPWELGLAETQQTLLLNGLRDRVTVQVDGQLKTGRDVIIAALLGAEEFGFATAPLIVVGLRDDAGLPPGHLPGRHRHPEPGAARAVHRQARVRGELLPVPRRGGARVPGRAGLPHPRGGDRPRRAARLAPGGGALEGPRARPDARCCTCPRSPRVAPGAASATQDHRLERALDNELLAAAAPALERRHAGHASRSPVRNEHRSVGAMLGGEVVRRFGGDGLPDDTIEVTLRGTAGQSFGAFVPRGVTLRLFGDANDYVGKGLSGGRLIVRPDRRRRSSTGRAGRGADHRRQHHPVRRDRRRAVPARPGGRAVRGPQLRRRRRSSRAWATTAAST